MVYTVSNCSLHNSFPLCCLLPCRVIDYFLILTAALAPSVSSSHSVSPWHLSTSSLRSLLYFTFLLSVSSPQSPVDLMWCLFVALVSSGLLCSQKLLLNINVDHLSAQGQAKHESLYFFYLPPSPLPCVCLCVVCGSYSMSEGWNGDDSLDQGKNSNTLLCTMPHVLHFTWLPINKKLYRQEKQGGGAVAHTVRLVVSLNSLSQVKKRQTLELLSKCPAC